MKSRRISIGLIFPLIFTVIAGAVVIEPPDDALPAAAGAAARELLSEDLRNSNVIMGGTFRIEPDETRRGDMVVFGGSGKIDGTLDGDLVVLGGHVTVKGRITGDTVVIGGRLDLYENARVDGNLMTLGSGVHRSNNAVIGKDSFMLSGQGFGFPGGKIKEHIADTISLFHVVALGFWLVAALFVVFLMSRNAERMTEAAGNDLLKALLAGFLFHTGILMASLFLAATVIGILLVLFLVFFWVIVCLVGVPVGFTLLGRILLHRFGIRHASVFLQTATGFIILGAARFIPYGGGFFIWHIWGMTGIGAVILTRFGSMRPWFAGRSHGAGERSVSLSGRSQEKPEYPELP